MTVREVKPSKVEELKAQSHYLRGAIVSELKNGRTYFTEESIQILKFHGMYQQDDRDLRAALKREGKEKAYSMMIRARIPGGVVTPEGYLTFDRLSDEHGNHTMRITTRQAFQLHGILKHHVKETLRKLNEALITTLGGCGDQVRNITMCSAPHSDEFHTELKRQLMEIVDAVSAKTSAYHEIWLDQEQVVFPAPEMEPQDPIARDNEPLYGETYLPRKFKIALAVEGDNCIDVYANDLGIVAHGDADHVAGYTLLVGGGMGRTASFADTYPRLADPLTFVTPDQLLETIRTIVSIQRDFGNRSERRYSRFKYLLDARGLPWFQEELENRLGRKLLPPRPLSWEHTTDHLGWHEQGDGRFYLGLFVQNGRIHDTDTVQLKSALREIVAQYKPIVRLTTDQNLLLSDLQEEDRESIETILSQAGVQLVEQVASVVRHAMACPALPTCGLATAESERVMPTLLTEFEALFNELGLAEETITIRMTGCANGCARPYVADIGFVGRTLGKYDIFLGGDMYGKHLNALYAELVPFQELTQTLRPILEAYSENRQTKEGLGEYCRRHIFIPAVNGAAAE